jgi:hypothetical protein
VRATRVRTRAIRNPGPHPFPTPLHIPPPFSHTADTEIDWRAYMQEVEGWVVDGDTDYVNLKGDTGPLVYPGGFMWIFRALRTLTGGGVDIRTAQWIFLAVYLATEAIVLDVYARTRPGPPWTVLLLAASKRLHSLYVLRLFNDCVGMLFAHAAIALFVRKQVREPSQERGRRGGRWGTGAAHSAPSREREQPPIQSTLPPLQHTPGPSGGFPRPPPPPPSSHRSGSSAASSTPSPSPSR